MIDDEFRDRLERVLAVAEELAKQVEVLRQAIVWTQEYALFPALPGWSWYDALMATGGVPEHLLEIERRRQERNRPPNPSRSVMERLRAGETVSADEIGVEGGGTYSAHAAVAPDGGVTQHMPLAYAGLSDAHLSSLTAEQRAKLCPRCGVRLAERHRGGLCRNCHEDPHG